MTMLKIKNSEFTGPLFKEQDKEKQFIFISGLQGTEAWEEYFKEFYKDYKIYLFSVTLPSEQEVNQNIEQNTHTQDDHLTTGHHEQIDTSTISNVLTKQAADKIKNIINEKVIPKDLPLVAHGIGGRIAVYLNVNYGIGSKLIIFGTRFFRRKFLRERLHDVIKKVTHSETLAKFLMPSLYATDLYTQLLVQLRNEDMSELLPQIEAPTLLIWADRDYTSPIVNGIEAHKKIKNSLFRVITDGTSEKPFKPVPEALKELLEDFINSNLNKV